MRPFNPQPKPFRFESQKMRDLANEVPYCMNRACRHPQDGSIVLIHSDSLSDQKGMGIKSHDLPAFGCKSCHDAIHGIVNPGQIRLTPSDARLLWTEIMIESLVWCLEERHMHVSSGRCKCDGEAA